MRRIGLFGGTFDPPHVGHLVLAECARDRLGLDEVRFIPAGQPPHKRRHPVSPSAARLAMVRLAVRGNRAFTVSTIEARRQGPSFTIDTLRRVAREAPRSRLYLLMGADSLDEFSTWREPREILTLATLAVAERPGSSGGSSGGRNGAGRQGARRRAGPGFRGRVAWLDNAEIDVSSSRVRARVRAGRSVRYLVPDAVAAYIARHRLYRSGR